jgi:hypothetical protein
MAGPSAVGWMVGVALAERSDRRNRDGHGREGDDLRTADPTAE